MSEYMLDVLSRHQRKLIFLLFSRDFEDSIEYFLLISEILTLDRNRYISLNTTVRSSYYLFLTFLKVFTNWKRQGSVRVSNSGFQMQDFFENIE